jgi:hypothetical protein
MQQPSAQKSKQVVPMGTQAPEVQLKSVVSQTSQASPPVPHASLLWPTFFKHSPLLVQQPSLHVSLSQVVASQMLLVGPQTTPSPEQDSQALPSLPHACAVSPSMHCVPLRQQPEV